MTIAKYFGYRALRSAVLLLVISILSFVLADLIPGNFYDDLRLNPQISARTLEALRGQYGLDEPLPARYARWVRSVLAGEMGYSLSYNSPAGPLLWVRARNTLLLTATATTVAWLFSLVLGIWSAAERRRWLHTLLSGAMFTLLSIPDVVIAVGLLVLAVRTGYFPAGGMVSVGFDEMPAMGKVKDVTAHLFLPAAGLVLGIMPLLLPHVHAAVAGVLDAPFIRAARAHGISARRVLWRHALPAAANPLVSLFGLSLAGLLSGSLVIEVVLSWPGLGQLLLQAILARDVYVVTGAVMLTAVFAIGGNLVADLLLCAVDPRIRLG